MIGNQPFISRIWSINGFAEKALSEFAHHQLIDETRDGLKIMSALLIFLVIVALLILNFTGMQKAHIQNYFLVMALAMHINISARTVNEIKVLHMLGMTLLIISATAFVLVAHQIGKFNPLLIANIILLFMTIPLIPWGLKEALIVMISIYTLLTLSTMSVPGRFETETLWVLHFFLLAACVTSLSMVIRSAMLRKREIVTHFELKKAHAELFKQSNQDALTGTWNRRYLKTAFDELVDRYDQHDGIFYFVVLDLDSFKNLNDLYGHDFGDRVLKITADTVREKLGERGCLIRIGGDEFIMMMVHSNPEAVMQDCLNTIRARVTEQNQHAFFSMTWGMESAPLQRVVDLEKLYQIADKSLYLNKQVSRTHEPYFRTEILR